MNLKEKIQVWQLGHEVKRVETTITEMLFQAIIDTNVVSSYEELKGMREQELQDRLRELCTKMGDMKPNDLQSFVNEILSGIPEEDNRRKNARVFLQQGIKVYREEEDRKPSISEID